MPAPYMSETAKVREMPHVMKYITGEILDYGCGGDKITPNSIGLDGRALPGVDIVVPDLEHPNGDLILELVHRFDTVYSSHFLEHTLNPREMVRMWYELLARKGKLVLYLPDGNFYSNEGNPEHMLDIKYKEFLFWFRRNFCGEGKNYKGEHLPKLFSIIDHGFDVGSDRYSFYVIAQVV
jgi:SAM-dependent methyltransferase